MKLRMIARCFVLLLARVRAVTGARAEDQRLTRAAWRRPALPVTAPTAAASAACPRVSPGQNKSYLLQQMKDFKAGKRPATIMHQHAKGYTDEQLELIAAYFASVKPDRRTGSARRLLGGDHDTHQTRIHQVDVRHRAVRAAIAGCATTGAGGGAGRVVVIGAGYGGATAAKYIRMWAPDIDVTRGRARHRVHLLPDQQPGAGRQRHDARHHHGLRRPARTTACSWCATRRSAIDAAKREVRLAAARRSATTG